MRRLLEFSGGGFNYPASNNCENATIDIYPAVLLESERRWWLAQMRAPSSLDTRFLSDFRIDQINVQVEANVSQKIGMWDVLGFALVQEKGKSVPLESKVTLYLEDGVWYMDMVEILTVVADPPPSPHKCSFKKAIPIAVLCGTK